MRHRLLASAGLLAGLFAASPVLAQTTPAQTTPAQAAPAAASSRVNMAVEHRITALHASLKITPAEQKPFDDFAQVMRDNASHMSGLVQQREQAAKTGTAVDQMQSYSAMAQAHAEDMQRLVPAFTTLYDTLSPDQKKAADQSFRAFANRPETARAARG